MRTLNVAVNVSQVPQRSPFRYPGGKTWLIPTLRRWLNAQQKPARVFIEPFAGGASAALMAVAEDHCEQAYFAELDDSVAKVWQCILSREGPALASAVESFSMSKTSVLKLLRSISSGSNPVQEALAVMVRNRIQRGGILATGAGRLKDGENGKGLKSRWYPKTLAARINAIHGLRDKLHFRHSDGFQLLNEFGQKTDVVAFVDPPYFEAAQRLYNCWEIDHRQVFVQLAQFKGDFLLAYDDAPQIRRLAAEFSFDTTAVKMKTTNHATKRELLIGKTVSWANQVPQKSLHVKAASVHLRRSAKTSLGRVVAA